MGVNRFMGPVETPITQTYIDQYVPLPFETMAAAAGSRQKVHDDVKANADALLLAHVDALPVDESLREEILTGISKEVDSLVEASGGDYSKLRGEISKLTMQTKENLLRGDLSRIQGEFNKKVAHDKSVAEAVKAGFDKGGIEALRGDEIRQKGMYDYNQTGGVRGGGSYSGLNPAAQYDTDRIAREVIKDWKADAFKSGKWKEDENGFMMIKKSSGFKRASATEIEAVVNQLLGDHPAIRAEAQQMLELGYAPEDVTGRLSRTARRMGEVYGFTETMSDEDIKLLSADLRSGASSVKKPELGYTFYSTSGMSKNIDPNKLEEKINEVEKQKDSLLKEYNKLSLLPPDIQASKRKDIDLQVDKLNFQKNVAKQTLEHMGSAGGFNWEEEYDSFVQSYGVDKKRKEEENPNYLPLTSKDINTVRELGKRDAPSFEEFKEAVIDKAYMNATPMGVDYESPLFKDRNFDYNRLKNSILSFEKSVQKPEATNFAQEQTVLIGGNKTYGKPLASTWAQAINRGAPELMLEDGSQFHKDNKMFSDVDWTKPVEVNLLKHFVSGRPSVMVTPKDSKGKDVGSYRLIVDKDSPLFNDYQELGKEMYMNAPMAWKSGAKISENLNEGAYIYGMSAYPEIMDSNVHMKPVDKQFDIPLGSGNLLLEVTPFQTGSTKKYKAFFKDKDTGETLPVIENEYIYDTPEQLAAAVGKFRLDYELKK